MRGNFLKVCILFLCLLNQFIFSQQNIIDSLRKLSEKAKTDSIKGIFLNKIGKEYWFINADSSIYYTDAAFKIATTKKINGVLPYCYNNYGVLRYLNADYSGALKKYFEGLKYVGNNTVLKCILMNNIGMNYMELMDYEKAKEYYIKTINIKKQTGDSARLATTYNNVGLVFKALRQFDAARLYFDTTLFLAKKFGDNITEADALGNIANHYSTLKKYNEAEKYCREAFAIKKKMQDSYGSITSASDLSSILMNLNKLDEAATILAEAEKTAIENRYIDGLLPIYQNFSQLYELKKNSDKSLYYLKKAMRVKDTILADGKVREAAVKEKEYSFGLIQVRDSLKNENEKIQTKLEHDKELYEQKLLTYSGIIGFGLMLLVAIIVFKAYRDKRKSNIIISEQKKEVEIQKELVEEKQKEIIDSITYAKRIQNTLLAHADFLNENIPVNFVLFQPKDIVSGDFYWATKIIQNDLNNIERFYLAVCDSTGHGVPGAFMSLLNIGFLSEAINEKSIYEPNKVLDYVRNRLIESISKEDQKDGFDGILLCIEKTGKETRITYAAAHNAPLLIHNNFIVELPKDKMPVGKGERKENFGLHEINFSEGDVLYLYTDGYADQFGGPKGKKFKYKPLNELLLALHQKPLNEQKNELFSEFNSWKGTLEQVDDVCVIGIKL